MGSEFRSSPLGALPKDWRLVRLKDITKKIGSGATPKGGESVYLSARQRVALIRSQNIFDRSFDEKGLAYISDEHANQLEGAFVQPQDILLNITGDGITFGRACLVSQRVLPACVNQHVTIIRPNSNICVSGYLLSYLTHPQIKLYIESFNAGGSRRAITKGHIESFEVPLPPITEQRAIAHILGTLDDKIELNRRMNQTLEDMARALFKEWFVDGAEAGWEVGQVRDLGQVICGKTPPTEDKENYDGEMPFITIPDMHGKVFVIKTTRTLSAKGVDTQSNKTLPKGAICVSCIATPGLVSITNQASQTNQQINSLIPADGRIVYYAYYLLKGLAEDIRARGSGGSVVTNLSKGQFESLPIVHAPRDIIYRYHATVEPLFMRLYENEIQSRTLAALRDALLPKLVSGELRVRDWEAELLRPRTPSEEASAQAYRRHLRPNDRYRRG